jgi:hypothetical protein
MYLQVKFQGKTPLNKEGQEMVKGRALAEREGK